MIKNIRRLSPFTLEHDLPTVKKGHLNEYLNADRDAKNSINLNYFIIL